jgi:hypothetical protein
MALDEHVTPYNLHFLEIDRYRGLCLTLVYIAEKYVSYTPITSDMKSITSGSAEPSTTVAATIF